MARNTLDLVEDCGLVHLHVFRYSARPGTPAARMPAVPADLRKRRAARLREAGENALAHFLAAQVGGVTLALVERPGQERTPHYAQIAIPRLHAAGSLVSVRVAAARRDRLLAEGACA
jgi:threonylcarbamoyladenosine tRNA methylthiotransferase MtaB